MFDRLAFVASGAYRAAPIVAGAARVELCGLLETKIVAAIWP